MKIAVINGSPKGEYSITLQSVKYLALRYPQHTFDIIHANSIIYAKGDKLANLREQIQSADALLFSYPVYTFIAPSQLHRAIEIFKQEGFYLSGKVATQISTSKHFYDITAHKYVEENICDLEMNYVRGLSADMEDLLTKKGQKELEAFFEHFLFATEHKLFHRTERKQGIKGSQPIFLPDEAEKIETTLNPSDLDVVLVTDCTDETSNLGKMIAYFKSIAPFPVRVENIAEYPLKGGCLGCFRCAVSGKCVYTDGFDTYLREKIQTADATVYAFTIRDHSMGSRFKMFDDRQFCNGHRTVTTGMPVGYLVEGNLQNEENLRTIMEARAEVGGNPLCGIATDETHTKESIESLVRELLYALENKYTIPANFYGVGGMKIFRDLIYQMRGMMRADHKFYKKRGIYDFPQKKWAVSLKMYLVGALLSNETILKKIGNKMNDGMLLPYNKFLSKVKPKD